MTKGHLLTLVATLLFAILGFSWLPGYCKLQDGFSGVTSLTLTCSRSTGVNEALAVDAPQAIAFTVDVDGGTDADLEGDVNLIRMSGPYCEWTPYFPPTNSSGEASVTSSFPDGGTIPNIVGSYNFQAWLRQKDGTQKLSNVLTVIVYKVQCIKIEAVNDQDIYWPSDPHTSDKVWAADPTVYAQNGSLSVNFDRRRIADVFRTAPQHYQLQYMFERYPTCQTSQSLSTSVGVTMGGTTSYETITGWNPSLYITDRSSVGSRSYEQSIAYKVNLTQVGDTQYVGGFTDFAIYGTPQCPSDKFTVILTIGSTDYNPLLSSCTWGSGGTTEATVAHNVMNGVSDDISSGCICDGSSAWQDDCWVGATGASNAGMCCCRAQGMIQALQVLGLSYTHAYVNERAEPGVKGSNPTRLDGRYCTICQHYIDYRFYWAGFWNNWEGTAYNGTAGTTHYGPAGRMEGTYAQIRTSVSPFYWTWVNTNDYASKCVHLSYP